MGINKFIGWKFGQCEVCGEICVNQFLPQYRSMLYLWRAVYWKKSIVCTVCVDDLSKNQKDKFDKKEEKRE